MSSWLSAVRNTWQREIGRHIAASTPFYSDLFILQHPAQLKLPHPPFSVKCFLSRIAVSCSVITECGFYPYRWSSSLKQIDEHVAHSLPLHLWTWNMLNFLCHGVECFESARLVKKGETLEVGFGNASFEVEVKWDRSHRESFWWPTAAESAACHRRCKRYYVARASIHQRRNAKYCFHNPCGCHWVEMWSVLSDTVRLNRVLKYISVLFLRKWAKRERHGVTALELESVGSHKALLQLLCRVHSRPVWNQCNNHTILIKIALLINQAIEWKEKHKIRKNKQWCWSCASWPT